MKKPSLPDFIYKICPETEWNKACDAGVYTGSPDDKRDGFIHFSLKNQVRGTLAKHFSGQDGLLMLVIDVARLNSSDLKYEISRRGETFPHLYGNLFPSAVKAQYIIRDGVILTEGAEGDSAQVIDF